MKIPRIYLLFAIVGLCPLVYLAIHTLYIQSKKLTTPMLKFSSTLPRNDSLKEVGYANEENQAIELAAPGERFNLRNQYLQEKCRENESRYKKIESKNWRIIFASKYNLSVCITSKIGETTWRTHVLSMMNINVNNGSVYTREMLNKINQDKKKYNVTDLMRKNKAVSIYLIRHPLSRLLSAYHDKFVNQNQRNRLTKRKYLEVLLEGKNITFSMFLRSIIIDKSLGNPVDNHWKSSYNNCGPCSVNYTYMIKQETFDEDLTFLKQNLTLKEIKPVHKHALIQDRTKSFPEYYKNLPDDLLSELYFMYEPDFVVAGYSVPDFMRNAVWKMSSVRL